MYQAHICQDKKNRVLSRSYDVDIYYKDLCLWLWYWVTGRDQTLWLNVTTQRLISYCLRCTVAAWNHLRCEVNRLSSLVPVAQDLLLLHQFVVLHWSPCWAGNTHSQFPFPGPSRTHISGQLSNSLSLRTWLVVCLSLTTVRFDLLVRIGCWHCNSSSAL